MTQISPETWCERLQAKMMAGLEAAWALIENNDDPVVVRKAREKARVCGAMAATARRIVLMTGPRRAPNPSMGPPMATEPSFAPQGDAPRPERGIDRLKGGRRGRL
jgi:hypothetical protein